MKKRILVIDRHELIHAGVSLALASHQSCTVLPPALSLQAALRRIAAQSPDLVVLDPYQPDTMGILTTLRDRYSDLGLLVLTDNDAAEDIQLALQQGVNGYVLKSAPVSDLMNAIEAVLEGETFLHPSVSHVLIENRTSEQSGFSLTKRQEQVLRLIAEGRTVKQIAGTLGVSAKTVESHRVTLMNRLGIHHVPGLVHFAIRYGYVQLAAPLKHKPAQCMLNQ